MVTKTIIIFLAVCMLGHDHLIQEAQAAAGAAAASANQASQASSTTTTTTTAINEASGASSSAGAASAAGAGGAAGAGSAVAAAGGGLSGPFSQVQGIVGNALSIASMPLNSITTSFNQLGLQNLAQAPFNVVSSLIHQAGNAYGGK